MFSVSATSCKQEFRGRLRQILINASVNEMFVVKMSVPFGSYHSINEPLQPYTDVNANNHNFNDNAYCYMLSKNSANSVITAIDIRLFRCNHVWFDEIKVFTLQKVDSRHVEKNKN